MVVLRGSDFACLQDSLPYTDALARAIRGEVEGIATPAGKIKYLRVLPVSERQAAPELIAVPVARESSSTIGARTNLGVYRQEIESARMDEYGIPTRIIIGHTYAFSLLRGGGL